MLLATSSGNRKLLEWIGKEAATKGNDNIAFLARFLVTDLEGCLEVSILLLLLLFCIVLIFIYGFLLFVCVCVRVWVGAVFLHF